MFLLLLYIDLEDVSKHLLISRILFYSGDSVDSVSSSSLDDSITSISQRPKIPTPTNSGLPPLLVGPVAPMRTSRTTLPNIVSIVLRSHRVVNFSRTSIIFMAVRYACVELFFLVCYLCSQRDADNVIVW